MWICFVQCLLEDCSHGVRDGISHLMTRCFGRPISKWCAHVAMCWNLSAQEEPLYRMPWTTSANSRGFSFFFFLKSNLRARKRSPCLRWFKLQSDSISFCSTSLGHMHGPVFFCIEEESHKDAIPRGKNLGGSYRGWCRWTCCFPLDGHAIIHYLNTFSALE